jgi:hypothetical protein
MNAASTPYPRGRSGRWAGISGRASGFGAHEYQEHQSEFALPADDRVVQSVSSGVLAAGPVRVRSPISWMLLWHRRRDSGNRYGVGSPEGDDRPERVKLSGRAGADRAVAGLGRLHCGPPVWLAALEFSALRAEASVN